MWFIFIQNNVINLRGLTFDTENKRTYAKTGSIKWRVRVGFTAKNIVYTAYCKVWIWTVQLFWAIFTPLTA